MVNVPARLYPAGHERNQIIWAFLASSALWVSGASYINNSNFQALGCPLWARLAVLHYEAGQGVDAAVLAQRVVHAAQGGGPAGRGQVGQAIAALVAARQQDVGVVAGHGIHLFLCSARAGGDRSATELAGQRGPVRSVRVGRHAADVVLVDVAAQQHGVAWCMACNGVQQALARGGVAVPGVGRVQARGVVAWREQGGLRQHAPARLGSGIQRQALVQPLLLGWAEHAAGRVFQRGAVVGARGAGAAGAGASARLQVAVLAGVEQVDVGQLPPVQPPVQRKTGRSQAGCAQRHVFVKGLPGRSAQGQKRGRIAFACTARIVVLYFVVVPGHGPGAAGMGDLQVGIAFVQGMAVAEIGQRGGMAQAVHAR